MSLSLSLSVCVCACARAVCFGNYHHASVSGVIWMDVFAVQSRAITAAQQSVEKESGGPAVRSRLHLHELQTCSHLSRCPSTPRDLRRGFRNREELQRMFVWFRVCFLNDMA